MEALKWFLQSENFCFSAALSDVNPSISGMWLDLSWATLIAHFQLQGSWVQKLQNNGEISLALEIDFTKMIWWLRFNKQVLLE